jgi:hypothetical protein
MSDFDAVLERLLAEPAFATALASDPAAALAGYRLSPDEVALLHSQVTGDTGGQSAVETRTNQSSVFGMLAPLAGIAGGIGDALGHGGLGHGGLGHDGVGGLAPATAGQPSTPGLGPTLPGGSSLAGPGLTGQALGDALAGPADGWGTGAGGAGTGGAGGAGPGEVGAGFGAADPSGTAGFGAADPSGTAGFGAAEPPSASGLVGIGDSVGDGIGAPLTSAQGPSYQPPEGYHIRVDVDGDGDWDRHRLHGRADGGVDILVDADRDGQVDFVGHDDDADGRVESAEYDKDGDGFFEKTMYDDTGDGWLDRTVKHSAPPSGIGDALGPGGT